MFLSFIFIAKELIHGDILGRVEDVRFNVGNVFPELRDQHLGHHTL